MSWRIVIISKRCKLDLKMGYMVVRGEETQRIFLDEMAILLIENPGVSLTGCLLEALTDKKIRVIFCDTRRSPMAELAPLHGSHDTTRKLRQQLAWSSEIKGVIWSKIVADKIQKQADHLAEQKKQKEALLLESYIPQIEFQDKTNRERHAAKVYFNAVFGKEFTKRDDNPMMLAYPQMDVVFDFENNHVNTLVIENPNFFCDFLRDIHMQIAGYSGKAVLSSEYMPISFSKSAEIIDSFLSFEINRKSLATKVISKLESIAMDESNYIRTAQIMGDLEKYIQDLSFDLPSDVYCSKMNIGGVLRSAGIEFADDYNNDLERLLDYMELTRELDREKLFVFVNLRSYYADESVSAFLSSVLDHGFSVLLVDSVSKEKLQEEQRITIDIDLCEF